MVNKSATAFLILSLALTLSCEREFTGSSLAEGINGSTDFYFLDAELYFNSTFVAPESLRYFVDLDPETPPGINDFLVSEQPSLLEVYSAFHPENPALENGGETAVLLEAFQDDYGFTYGSVRYDGLGFCFFLPGSMQEQADKGLRQAFLTEGQELAFGSMPGQAEIGYFKNHPELQQRPDRGLVTTAASNEGGSLKVEEVRETTTLNGQSGFQVRVAFQCRLYQQYSEAYAAELTGEAVLFLPQP